MTDETAAHRAAEELRLVIGLADVRPTRHDNAVGPTPLFEVNTPLGRGFAGSLIVNLGDLERFSVGAFGGAPRISGNGAPRSLLRELPSRWAGIGRVEVRYRDGLITSLCWGYDAGERGRARRYTEALVAAVRGWAEVAPKIWEPGPRLRPAAQVIEEELAWLAPNVADGGATVRARILVDEGPGFAGELRLEDGRAVFELARPPGPRIALTPQRTELFGWWRRRDELRLGDGPIDDAFEIRGGEESQDWIAALRGPLLEIRDHDGSLRLAEALVVEVSIEDGLAAPLRCAAGLCGEVVRLGLGL